ncbi:hypothetical protein SprV_0100000900 [Sparganum proliferum]
MPSEFLRTLYLSLPGQLLGPKVSSSYKTSREIEERDDIFIYTLNVERIGDTDETVFLCAAADDIQKQTVHWHVKKNETIKERLSGAFDETSSQRPQEFSIPVEELALSSTLQNYLTQAQVHVEFSDGIFTMSPNATLDVNCSIDNGSMLWLCTAHFIDAKLQLLMRSDNETKIKETSISGNTYEISGKFKIQRFAK